MQDEFVIKMGPKKKDVIISVSFTSIRFCRALCLALHVCMAMVVVPVWSANGVIKKYETESRRQERAVIPDDQCPLFGSSATLLQQTKSPGT